MLDLKNSKYVILEIIPTSVDPKKGDIAQISALKINGLNLIDRFDYRLEKDMILIPDILNMIDYDNDKFKYKKSTKSIIKEFKKFIGNLALLIIDNDYTNNYLIDIDNKKESVFDYINMKYSFDVFDKIIEKYGLAYSNHLVDLLYEALISELS